MEEMRPDLVVTDILTVAPALAAEAVGVPFATLIPHVYPPQDPGTPFFAFGFLPARTAAGRWAWRRWQPLLEAGLRQGRDEYNQTRARVGLPPLDRLHSGLSDELTLVATFPHLEYPRAWPDHVHVTGPMFFEVPHPEIEIPDGDDPLVLVAPSTAQDPDSNLVLAALEALDGEPVRVVATTNLMRRAREIDAPPNATVVDWVSYSQLMPPADLVISHGGHGTSARALAEGVPLLSVPAFGDTAENGARITWAGAGLMVPRSLAGPRTLRATVRRILREPRFAERAREIAEWSARNDGAKRGAEIVEQHVVTGAARGKVS
jgi:MGT family glycosyltransferase